MNVFVTWITGQTTLEIMDAPRLDILRRSNRVKRLETYQNGALIVLRGETIEQ